MDCGPQSCRGAGNGATGPAGGASLPVMGTFRSTLRNSEIGEQDLICPKCGEVNSSNFLFCGLCGTMLEPARKATAPAPTATVREEPRPVETRPVEPRPPAVAAPPAPAPPPAITPERIPKPAAVSESVPPIGGPSLLGLDSPNVDVLRERAFTSLESYGEGQSKSRAGRLLLLLLLLGALGGGYWWTYTNYLKVTDARKGTASTENPNTDEGGSPDSEPANTAKTETENLPRSTPRAQPPLVAPEPPGKKSQPQAQQAETEAPAAPTHQVSASRLPATQPAALDNGEALFRQGERYLYGRGGPQDCNNATKYLKMASDKQNAKARSAMGTMYATGHCVSRDLPNAYRWFALSLRADPNNSVVEKNLSAVWNQMTPPERQLATKSQ